MEKHYVQLDGKPADAHVTGPVLAMAWHDPSK
jgi:hypothetical protein